VLKGTSTVLKTSRVGDCPAEFLHFQQFHSGMGFSLTHQGHRLEGCDPIAQGGRVKGGIEIEQGCHWSHRIHGHGQ